MTRRIPFNFEFDVGVFEKADAPNGKQKRIGGIISTETPDRQGEVVLQSGLEFGDFMRNGWFNDNHSKETTDIVGYPEQIKRFYKGDRLPDGNQAHANGTWVEGYLLDTPKGKQIWDLGLALQKTDRRLGFSVEGKVERRAGPRTIFLKGQEGEGQWVGRNIVKAVVRNVAVTNAPVQADSRMEILAKSMIAMEREELEDDDVDKALAMGPVSPGQKLAGPQTGGGAGKVLTRQHLEEEEHDLIKESNVKKSLTYEEAIRFVQKSMPSVSLKSARRFVDLTLLLKRQGHL